MKALSHTVVLATASLFAAVHSFANPFQPTVSAETFYNYWFDGTAEITTFRLDQARYGEIHEGTATLVFVTENFLPVAQVKDETGHDHSVPVLKLNFLKSFQTGIYPYSLMFSSFTQVDGSGRLLKLTETSQDWCGHSFSQINWREDEYDYRRYSYFEAKGDLANSFPDVWLEDQLWTLARFNPRALPVGQFPVWPGSFFKRLVHVPATVTEATAELRETRRKLKYRIEFAHTDRVLEIAIEKGFPHRILGWEETYNGIALNGEAERLTTRATLIRTTKTDYWNHNSKSDRSWASQLYRSSRVGPRR